MLKQEVAFFDKTRTGELINRLSQMQPSGALSGGEPLQTGSGLERRPLLASAQWYVPQLLCLSVPPWQGEPHSGELCSALCRGLGDPGQLPCCWL